jgi:hypothetical protein
MPSFFEPVRAALQRVLWRTCVSRAADYLGIRRIKKPRQGFSAWAAKTSTRRGSAKGTRFGGEAGDLNLMPEVAC